MANYQTPGVYVEEIEKINASAIKLEEDGSININNDCFVNNPTAVVEDALERLGFTKINVIIGNTSKVIEGEVNFTIRYIASKGHFQLGDENGDLIWDPYKYNNSENAYTGTYSSIRSIKIAALKVKK
jgi:hypothetical protein